MQTLCSLCWVGVLLGSGDQAPFAEGCWAPEAPCLLRVQPQWSPHVQAGLSRPASLPAWPPAPWPHEARQCRCSASPGRWGTWMQHAAGSGHPGSADVSPERSLAGLTHRRQVCVPGPCFGGPRTAFSFLLRSPESTPVPSISQAGGLSPFLVGLCGRHSQDVGRAH